MPWIFLILVLFGHEDMLQVAGSDNFEPMAIQYHLWNKNNSGPKPQTLLLSSDISGISLSNPLKVYIHGFMNTGLDDISRNLKRAYLDTYKKEVTFVAVDWRKYAGTRLIQYVSIIEHVPKVVSHVTAFLNKLLEAGANPESTHLIGFSIGAHIAGLVGEALDGVIARVTGLDPAGPMFPSGKPRLSTSAGQFVDVIHSTGLPVGLPDKLGHIDVYPNSGEAVQPGCEEEDTMPIEVRCSHQYATKLFTRSIRSPGRYLSRFCPSWLSFKGGSCNDNHFLYLGEYTLPCQRGVYYLKTQSEKPFYVDSNKEYEPEKCVHPKEEL